MKTQIKQFKVLNSPFRRLVGLSFVILLGCAAALVWFAPPQSAFSFLKGGENPQPKQIAVTPADKSDASKKTSLPRRQPGGEERSQDNVWNEIQLESLIGRIAEGVPETARALELNSKALNKILNSAPDDSAETLSYLSKSEAILQLPLPEGGFMRFRIVDSPVMEAGLLEKFPEIKSYRGQSIDDMRVSMRADLSPLGFHATILTADKMISIHPARYDDVNRYVSYYNDDFNGAPFSCRVTQSDDRQSNDDDLKVNALIDEEVNAWIDEEDAPGIATGPTLRIYRFAIAVTQEYYNDDALGGDSDANTTASLNTWVNALNVIYERELAVRFTLVTNSQIIFKVEPDGLTNSHSGTMSNEIQSILEAKVGLANYDIGHVLAQQSDGGTAGLGVMCSDGIGKGAGASGTVQPVGNVGTLKLFAHEVGHQFGAPHTWNACNGGTRVHSSTAYEVGSGSTIMGYGGTCESDNLAGNNDVRFHAISHKNINDHINRYPQCGAQQGTGNAAPVVDAGAGYTIPKLTPFALTASATDVTNDVRNLTYTWEQFDAGGLLYGNPPYGDQPADPETTTRPIFRAYPPTSNPTRVFPSLTYILNNANDPPETILDGNQTRQVGEKLPSVGRVLKFRVTARDNRSGGGGTRDDDMRLTVAGDAGPFLVTTPNTAVAWTGGTTQTITWAVNNTNIAPVSATNVKISLSSDGGQTFPVVLAASVPNDGSETVNVPNGIQTETARVKIEAVGNIFFDISDANFTINNADSCPIISGVAPGAGSAGSIVTISGSNFTGVSTVKYGGGVIDPNFTVVNNTTITTTIPAGASSGAITISKTGCGDKQTTPLSVCFSSPQTFILDDGSHDGSYGDSYHVNRLTPPAGNYPATLTHVQIYFHNSNNNATVGEQFTILAGANTDGDTNINNTAFQSVAATVKSVGGFNTYALATPITITSGDFVVGYKLTTGRNGAADNTTPKSRSYYSGDGVGFNLTTGTNYMIRGQFSRNCSPATAISPGAQSFNASAGNGSIAITSSTPWTTTSNNSWITINSGASGSGGGTVVYAVAQNGTGAPRTGTMTVAGQTFTVTQTACAIGFSPFPNTTIGAAGGTFDITVSAPAGCSWTAASNASWITVNSGASGSNNGTITYTATANIEKTGRTGTMTIAGQTLTVTQTACPGSASMIFDEDEVNGSGSGTHFVQRLTPTSYPATLTHVQIYFHGGYPSTDSTPPSDSKVMILAGKNVDGDANINNSIQQTFEVGTGTIRDAYTTFALQTPITISSGDFVVGFKTVSGAPAFPLSFETAVPTRGRSYSSGDGSAFVNVSDADYKIRGQYKSFCPDGTISPTSRAVTGSSATGTVSVTATGAWTAFSNDVWITVTGDPTRMGHRIAEYNGTGNGTVSYTIGANNSGASRSGSMTIAGVVFTVTQSAIPTAASVSIGGRVLTSAGIGVGGATVRLVDQTGQSRIVRTSSFGYYRFDEVEGGETIVLSVTSKRYAFTPQVVTVHDSVQNLDFVSLE